MLDITDFREGKGGNLAKLRELQSRRFADPKQIDKVVELDDAWRNAVYKVEGLKRDFNAHNKLIGQYRKEGRDTTQLQSESREKKAQIEQAEAATREALDKRDKALGVIGNYVHDSVPVSQDEAENVVVRTWGDRREEADLHNHVDLVEMLDIVDLDKGTAIRGGRGYFLKGAGVFLNQALVQFALEHGYSNGMQPIMTPFMMRQSVMAGCAQLSTFDDELYKVTEITEKFNKNTVGEGEDKYMIATAEQPLCAYHKDSWFQEKDLPLKYIGFSTCFRKEAGSHGRDTNGIFRVHQFEKVEQFIVTSPAGHASWEAFEEMIANSEDFYQQLGLPYQIVNIVSGELNNAASKKYDLEAWFPASKAYRELVSCSNCTDYQSRRLEARLRSATGPGQEAKKEYVHMLNCTLTATERTLCCVLENYQTPEGFNVPKALQRFMPGGISFLPFTKTVDQKRLLGGKKGDKA